MGVQIHAKEARIFGDTKHHERQLRRARMSLAERRQRRRELRLITGKTLRCPACKLTAEQHHMKTKLSGGKLPCPDIFHLQHMTEEDWRNAF